MQYKENSWSDWTDFNEDNISEIPQKAGVFMMHSAMQILCIEGTKNIKNTITGKFLQRYTSDNTRLRYMITEDFERISENMIRDYKNRHEGNLPLCMQE